MSETIDKQEAIDMILGQPPELHYPAWYAEQIRSMTPAQPEPKRGKWIKTARWGRVYYCDQCRNYLDFDGVNAGRGSANWCPNCGADMREVTE